MIGSRPKPGGNNKQEANSGASSHGPNPVRTVAVHRRLLGENIAPSKRSKGGDSNLEVDVVGLPGYDLGAPSPEQEQTRVTLS
jgi:hypothetical protein